MMQDNYVGVNGPCAVGCTPLAGAICIASLRVKLIWPAKPRCVTDVWVKGPGIAFPPCGKRQCCANTTEFTLMATAGCSETETGKGVTQTVQVFSKAGCAPIDKKLEFRGMICCRPCADTGTVGVR